MDGALRNVIVFFFTLPALQGPETLVFTAFLLGIKHMIDDYQMGNVKYSSSNSPYYFYAPVRALYGELMIPVYDLEYSHDEVYVHWQGEWDMEENTLTIPIIYVKPIFTGT